MPVKLNDQDILNWVDYVQKKFADSSLYEILESDKQIEVRSKTNETVIWFSLAADSNGEQLYDCQFYSDQNKSWSGETLAPNAEYGIFNQRNVNALNSVLETPIKHGWLSVNYCIGNAVLKTKTYLDQDRNAVPFVEYNGGCLSLLLFPFLWLLIKLIDLELIGRKTETEVTPIENNNY